MSKLKQEIFQKPTKLNKYVNIKNTKNVKLNILDNSSTPYHSSQAPSSPSTSSPTSSILHVLQSHLHHHHLDLCHP